MQVIKRDNTKENISLDKVTRRVSKMAVVNKKLDIDAVEVAQKSVGGLYDGITTVEIDDFICSTSASMVHIDPDYGLLAGRIKVNNLHKDTSGFEYALKKMNSLGLLRKSYYKKALNNLEDILKIIDYNRDYNHDIFSVNTLMRGYLVSQQTGQLDSVPLERIQDMWMRVALTVTKEPYCSEDVKTTYDLLSKGYYTHATPTLFNSGLKMQQLSSCFLIALEDDSIDGIFNTLKDCANISKSAGGIGLHTHNLRSCGSYIKGTNGRSSGLIPFLKIFNETAKAVNQGGKRKGSFAIYLEPWHGDIIEFLDLKTNTGSEEFKARDLFLALWIPDLFMERVEADEMWTLMDEYKCPGLSDVYGDEFKKLYESYEKKYPNLRKIKARDLMVKIITAQIETGMPYISYKDAVNAKNNQSNLGIIKSSNLCNEIVQYSDNKETAVCNLASLNLPKFIKENKNGEKLFDFSNLIKVTKIAIKNLNAVIDVNDYPTNKCKVSNLKHRPVALGVQGLADVYMIMGLPYDSDEANTLNKKIFECIYYGSLQSSMELAKINGPYETFKGSPLSEGRFQFDLWGDFTSPCNIEGGPDKKAWDRLRANIVKHGVRNSLVTALMPTASTSNIMGSTECFQAQVSNIYKRQVLSGEYILVNKYLVKDLKALGLWNKQMQDTITINNGSIQTIDSIPDNIKSIYKTVWEISQKAIIDQCASRGPFIDQTQSMNLWLKKPTVGSVNSMHFYAWKKGLKTGMYYLRSRPAADAVKITTASKTDSEECESCSA